MRAIKFRAWDVKEKLMILPPNKLSSCVGKLFFTMDGRCYIQGIYQDLELMQYTGLKDKNGVEIYEDDVLSSPHFTDAAGREHTLNHLVEWSDKLHGWFLLSCSSKDPNDGSLQMFVATRNTEMSVIGNLHQNPELIK